MNIDTQIHSDTSPCESALPDTPGSQTSLMSSEHDLQQECLPQPKKGKNRNQKRETLASRARKYIGRPIELPEEELGDETKQQKKAKATKEDKDIRRRQQVLKAQRTHRMRTLGYIKELEKEVHNSRVGQLCCSCHNDTLLMRIKTLETTLHHHNIELPPKESRTSFTSSSLDNHFGHNTVSQPFAHQVDGQLNRFAVQAQQHHCDLSTVSTFPSDLDNISIPLETFASFQQYPQNGTQFPNNPGYPGEDFMMGLVEPCDIHMAGAVPPLNSEQALAFVLNLERVCAPHLNWSVLQKEYEVGTNNVERGIAQFDHDCEISSGHAFAAASQVIEQGINRDYTDAEVSEGVTKRNVKIDMNKILEGALHPDWGDDVSPLQIWANIARMNRLGRPEVCQENIDRMQMEFAKYAVCKGFGTTIPKDVVNRIFGFFIPGERYEVTWSRTSHHMAGQHHG